MANKVTGGEGIFGSISTGSLSINGSALPTQEAITYYVSKSGSTGATGKSWAKAVPTIQEAINKVTAGSGLTGKNRAVRIVVGAGQFDEQLIIADRRYISIIGAGRGKTIITNNGVSGMSAVVAMGEASASPVIICAARGFHLSDVTIMGSGAAHGIYIGDGGRVTGAGYNYHAKDCTLQRIQFDGATFDGKYAILLDGAKGCIMDDLDIWQWVSGGVHLASGLYLGAERNWLRRSSIQCRGYGVRKPDAAICNDNVVGPKNVFLDDNTTAMTRSCLFGSGGGRNAFVGNYDATTNGALGQSTDFMSGNTELHAMNSPVYIAES